jgi:hypothetical protein
LKDIHFKEVGFLVGPRVKIMNWLEKHSPATESKTVANPSSKRKYEDSNADEEDGAKAKEEAIRDAEDAALEDEAAAAPDVPGVDDDETVTEESDNAKEAEDEYEPESNKEKEEDSDYDRSESEQDSAKPRKPPKTRPPEVRAEIRASLSALSLDELMTQLRQKKPKTWENRQINGSWTQVVVGEPANRRRFALQDIYIETDRRIRLGDPIVIARLTNAIIKKTEGHGAYCSNARILSALTGRELDSTESAVLRRRKRRRKMIAPPVASVGVGAHSVGVGAHSVGVGAHSVGVGAHSVGVGAHSVGVGVGGAAGDAFIIAASASVSAGIAARAPSVAAEQMPSEVSAAPRVLPSSLPSQTYSPGRQLTIPTVVGGWAAMGNGHSSFSAVADTATRIHRYSSAASATAVTSAAPHPMMIKDEALSSASSPPSHSVSSSPPDRRTNRSSFSRVVPPSTTLALAGGTNSPAALSIVPPVTRVLGRYLTTGQNGLNPGRFGNSSGANGVHFAAGCQRSETKTTVSAKRTYQRVFSDKKSAIITVAASAPLRSTVPTIAALSGGTTVPTIYTVSDSTISASTIATRPPIALMSATTEEKKEEIIRAIHEKRLKIQKLRAEYKAKEEKLRHTSRMYLIIKENSKKLKEAADRDPATPPLAL